MRHEVEVRSQLGGRWQRALLIVEAATAEQAADLAKRKARAKAPKATVHLVYGVRPLGEKPAPARPQPKTTKTGRAKRRAARA